MPTISGLWGTPLWTTIGLNETFTTVWVFSCHFSFPFPCQLCWTCIMVLSLSLPTLPQFSFIFHRFCSQHICTSKSILVYIPEDATTMYNSCPSLCTCLVPGLCFLAYTAHPLKIDTSPLPYLDPQARFSKPGSAVSVDQLKHLSAGHCQSACSSCFLYLLLLNPL